MAKTPLPKKMKNSYHSKQKDDGVIETPASPCRRRDI